MLAPEPVALTPQSGDQDAGVHCREVDATIHPATRTVE